MDIENQILLEKKEYANAPTFEKLEKLRKIMVTAQDANEVSEGFKNILTKLYPDTAHYIFELLQNAQDANKDNDKPSTVNFILYEDKLEFEHNGKKLFNLEDVKSITGIKSTKIDDKTNIGKFGVGFKSVFAITNTPEIISGDYHFNIEKMFIPKLIKNITNNPSQKSRFIFPFNNPQKNPKTIVEEIRNELINLGSETLLFLNKINKIEYSLPYNKTPGYIEQIEKEGDGIITIKVKIPDEDEKIYYWLRYIDKIDILDENGENIPCPIAIAFKLEKNEQKDSESKWKIISPVNNQGIEKGEVCIFFPATSEYSNLFFHIHAPFASTVARNCIRPCEENDKLRDSIAELIAKSLIDIKKSDLLSMGFLGILPNTDDNLSDFYGPIRNKIITEFKEKPLVPTKNGNYASANELYRCPPRKQGGLSISEIIDDDDLSLLIGRKPPLWVKNANLKNQRDDKFLTSLEIKQWGSDDLKLILNPKLDEEQYKIETWINNKSDEWLMKFYALLYNEDILVDTKLKIVRLITKNMVSPSEEIYFLPKNEGDIPSNLNFVESDIYNIGDDEKRKKDAYSFLEKIGVKPYTEDEKIKLRLKDMAKKYIISNPDVPEKQYLEDIKEFCEYKGSKELLVDKYFVLDTNNNFRKAADVCTPIISKLIECAEISSEYKNVSINNIYEEKLNKEQYDKFINLIKELGAMYKLEVIINEEYKTINSGKYEYKIKISRDYIIKGLEKIIQILDLKQFEQYRLQFPKLIWDAVQDYHEWGVQYKFTEPDERYKSSFGFKNFIEPSTIVKILTSSAWIPDKDKVFLKPQDITYDMLPNDFEIRNNSYPYLLKALRFGENVPEGPKGLIKQVEAANILGISLEQANIIKKANETGIDIVSFLNEYIIKINTRKNQEGIFVPQEEFPIGRFPNLLSLQELIKKEYFSAKYVKYEDKTRHIRISRDKNNERSRIGAYYSGFCQLCGDKKNYWDVTQIFKFKKNEIGYKKEFWYMNLSLCPICARKYRRLRKKNELMELFKKNILNINIIDTNIKKEIEINLIKEKVKFRHDHLAEIQEILKLELEAEKTFNNPTNQSL